MKLLIASGFLDLPSLGVCGVTGCGCGSGQTFCCSCCGRQQCLCQRAQPDQLCWDCWQTQVELSESLLFGQLVRQ